MPPRQRVINPRRARAYDAGEIDAALEDRDAFRGEGRDVSRENTKPVRRERVPPEGIITQMGSTAWGEIDRALGTLTTRQLRKDAARTAASVLDPKSTRNWTKKIKARKNQTEVRRREAEVKVFEGGAERERRRQEKKHREVRKRQMPKTPAVPALDPTRIAKVASEKTKADVSECERGAEARELGLDPATASEAEVAAKDAENARGGRAALRKVAAASSLRRSNPAGARHPTPRRRPRTIRAAPRGVAATVGRRRRRREDISPTPVAARDDPSTAGITTSAR